MNAVSCASQHLSPSDVDALLSRVKEELASKKVVISPEWAINGDYDRTILRFLRGEKYDTANAFNALQSACLQGFVGVCHYHKLEVSVWREVRAGPGA